MPPKRGIPEYVVGDQSRYVIGETLGKGGFGIVKMATRERTGQQFAAKIVDMGMVRQQNILEYVDRETRLIAKLNHPHIIALQEVIDVREYDLRFYIMELAPNGELFDQIVAVHRFPESTARRYYQQFISGVRYCHSQGVVHRDLKAENLLLSRDNRLKICDFGLSRNIGEDAFGDHPTMFTSIAGSLDYQAPEMLRDQRYHGKPADIWSCGVILAFMLCGQLPFQDPGGDEKTKKRILKAEYTIYKDISPEAKDLIKKCLVVDVPSRITADGIIQHPWFRVGLTRELCDQLKIPLRLLFDEPESTSPVSPVCDPAEEVPFLSSERFAKVDKSLLRQLRVAFDSIDTDHSGYIRPEELRDVLIKLNNTGSDTAWIPSHDEVQELLKFFDTAGNGIISFSEFVVGYVEKKVETAHSLGQRLKLKDLIAHLGTFDLGSFETEYVNQMREAFNHIDEDKSGVIHKNELAHLFQRAGIEVTPDDVSDLFAFMDAGKQDFITFEEFVSAWTSSLQDGAQGQDQAKTGCARRLMERLRKCEELIAVAQADEARKVLAQATILGFTLKGSIPEVMDMAEKTLRELDGMRCHVERSDRAHSLRVRVEDAKGVTICEAIISALTSLTNFSRLSTRRVTGATTQFHSFYNAFQKAIEGLDQFTSATNMLGEVGTEVYV
eukprot:Sspe_Gene.54826::Locus_30210_Transcript_1_1_Confidence_1.000_Length_2140::g.54826::m.54826/K07198/PRKAA, AMPK; 5'-AMP-activated protein kinase, catalytic alpha subunit